MLKSRKSRLNAACSKPGKITASRYGRVVNSSKRRSLRLFLRLDTPAGQFPCTVSQASAGADPATCEQCYPQGNPHKLGVKIGCSGLKMLAPSYQQINQISIFHRKRVNHASRPAGYLVNFRAQPAKPVLARLWGFVNIVIHRVAHRNRG